MQVIPLGDTGQLGEAFNLRFDDLHVLDLTFLHTPSARRPLLAVLSQDPKEARHLRTYEVHVLEKDLVDGPWQAERLDAGASTLIPVPAPLGGTLVLGSSSVSFVGPSSGAGPSAGGDVLIKATPMKHTKIYAYERIVDADRYLLGDSTGRLMLLKLQHEGGVVQALQLQPLGASGAVGSDTVREDAPWFCAMTIIIFLVSFFVLVPTQLCTLRGCLYHEVVPTKSLLWFLLLCTHSHVSMLALTMHPHV